MVTIRKAVDSDIQDIRKLTDNAPEMQNIEELKLNNYYKYLIRGGIVLVAEEDEVLGVCLGRFNKKYKSAEILGLVVKPELRKAGIARKLIEDFESYAKSKKLKSIKFNADITQAKLLSLLNYQNGKSLIPFNKAI